MVSGHVIKVGEWDTLADKFKKCVFFETCDHENFSQNKCTSTLPQLLPTPACNMKWAEGVRLETTVLDTLAIYRKLPQVLWGA